MATSESETSETMAETSPEEFTAKKKVKPKKGKPASSPGIIYLSRIPKYMSVAKFRQILSQYGDLGRIFLQRDDRVRKFKKKVIIFTEGWVEFKDKRIAKRVVEMLNCKAVGGKRKNPWYEELWNMKYLHGFKWVHLNERLAYEKALHEQRMRTEVAQAKKEANHYIENVEKRNVQERLEKRGKDDEITFREWDYRQKETEEEILSKKKRTLDTSAAAGKESKPKRQKTNKDSDKTVGLDRSFLKNLFSGGID